MAHHYTFCRPVAFPLGSLGRWEDLLALNKQIELDSREPSPKGVVQGVVGQFTFYQQSAVVVDAAHVEAIFRSSTSRKMSPDILYHVGMWHIRKFFGPMSVGVASDDSPQPLRFPLTREH